jgi:ubiquinone/menaquinone biosynthesis C-methylase UbiE
MENHRVSFDRVASVYEDTRGHPPEISRQIADSLRNHLPASSAILEVGIGTGRIARPLLYHNLRLFGVDVSARMMARLLELLRPALQGQISARQMPVAFHTKAAHFMQCYPFMSFT